MGWGVEMGAGWASGVRQGATGFYPEVEDRLVSCTSRGECAGVPGAVYTYRVYF